MNPVSVKQEMTPRSVDASQGLTTWPLTGADAGVGTAITAARRLERMMRTRILETEGG
jgi:hypothetical protein